MDRSADMPVSSDEHSSEIYPALRRVLEDLLTCVRDLEAASSGQVGQGASDAPADLRVPSLTVRRLCSCAAELVGLSVPENLPGGGRNLCEVLGCPRWPAHLSAFRDAIRVLQETKRRFKSKELADLRQRLNRHLGTSEK